MSVERSAGAVIFHKSSERVIEYLLLHYDAGHWDFPKGHIEKGESIEETVLREVREETGLVEIKFVPGFRETIRYFFKAGTENRLKFVVFLLAESATKEVKISWEHQGYIWLPFREAYTKITYKNAKEVLKKANQFLKKSS